MIDCMLKVCVLAGILIIGLVSINAPVKADDSVQNSIIEQCMDGTPDSNDVFHVRDWLGLGCMIRDGNAPVGSYPNKTST